MDGGSVWEEIRVPQGTGQRSILFPVPYVDGFGTRTRVESIGPSDRTLHHLLSHRASNDGTAPFAVVDPSEDAFAQDLGKIFGAAESYMTHSPSPLAKRFQGQVPPLKRFMVGTFPPLHGLPTQPEGFSGLSGLWVNAVAWKNAPDAVRLGIRDWVRAGGRLYVPTSGQPALKDLPSASADLGLGRVTFEKPLDSSNLKALAEEVLALDQNPFPGRVEDYAEWKSDLLPPFELHIRWLLGLLFGFVILLLPVNFLWLAPLQKRHRLFVTVPVISLIGGIVLVVVILVTDGRGGTGIRNGLVLVGEGSERSVFYQEQLSRTGMVSSTRFNLPADVAFVVCKLERPDAFRSIRSGHETAGNWFASRAIQAHALQQWISPGAGVAIQQEADGAPRLVAKAVTSSGPVFYCDRDGEYWTAPRLEAGVPTALVRSSAGAFEDWFGKSVSDPSSNLRARMREASKRRDWFFTAAAGGTDFWIPTLPQVRWIRDEMVLVGPVQREVAP
jgi:hypothetical protein